MHANSLSSAFRAFPGGKDTPATKAFDELVAESGLIQQAILDSEHFAVIATDATGTIGLFNVGAERMLGYTASEVVGRLTPADIADPPECSTPTAEAASMPAPANPSGFEALMQKATRRVEDVYELIFVCKNGSRFPAIVSVFAFFIADGPIIGYLFVATNNVARKNANLKRLLADAHLQVVIEKTVDCSIVLLGRDANGFQDHLDGEPSVRRILYVEDIPRELKLLSQLQSRPPRAYPRTAQNGNPGIQPARNRFPDVILMNIGLPGMGGINALNTLRKEQATAHIPIIAVSCNAEPNNREDIRQSGFFKHLGKPVYADELLDVLDLALIFSTIVRPAAYEAA